MKFGRHMILAPVLACLTIASVADAQVPDASAIVERLSVLEELVRGIEGHLDELSRQLESARLMPPSPVIQNVQPFSLGVVDTAAQGSARAPVTLVELSDFQCPFCGRHAQQVYPESLRRFVDAGQVRYVIKNLPIEESHPQALKAAEAAECAREQGKYWEMHAQLFRNQQALSQPDLIHYASGLGIDLGSFRTCLEEGHTTALVKMNQSEARRLGITGTPTFLLGGPEADGAVVVTRKLVGAQPLAVFERAIEDLLGSESAK
jgi:protein-disulfide isomerase